jgi:CRISPR-associated endonuclease/helicase Cas3
MTMPTLYPYQQQVYRHLMNGKNVIIQAPTGAGKTLAALYPYFENLVKSVESASEATSPLPLTCRYAVPMRVLATQFEHEHHDYFAKLDRKRGTRFLEQYHERLGINVPAIQTGETPEDPKFESPLTFCTIDQLLASFIGTPYSLSPRLANLNVGAVVGSYLILDEFHLYPLDHGSGARMTALAMLSMLKGLSPFVLMTATFSSKLLNELGNALSAEIVRVEDQAELDKIMAGRSRAIRQVDGVMTPEAILAAHDAARGRGAGASLVVCNTVARAQAIYLQLRDALAARGRREDTRLALLHSRFTPEDRKQKSKDLEDWLGEKQWRAGQFQGPDTIVVGTQVVEVGLNISAGVLHTELAPANSLIQRAGRCARFRQQYGEVLVYRIPARADGAVSTLPYDAPTCENTWNHLGAMIEAAGPQGLEFGFAQEQQLIDAIHTEDDTRMLEQFHTTVGQTKRTIMDVLATHERGKEGELIRNVSQVAVLIHPEPEQAITVRPFIWESFGLFPGSLMGAWESLHARRDALGMDAPNWIMKELVPGEDALGTDEGDNAREAHYDWKVVTSRAQILSASRIALPPELATYDAEIGFRLLVPEDPLPQKEERWQSSPVEPKKARRSGEIRAQRSYVEHISGLMRAYDWSARRELAWIAARLEHALLLSPESVDLAVRLAIACHDLGKLSKGWQAWARATQDLLVQKHGPQYQVQPEREWLAKTDGLANWQEEKQLQKELREKKPRHACIGVMASAVLIGQRLLQGLSDTQREGGMLLAKAALSAIARHHAPTARDYDATEWQQDAVQGVIAEAFRACRLSTDLTGLNLGAQPAGEVSSQRLIVPGCETDQNERATWLGFVLVRALRLCDQRAEQEL